MNRAFPPIAAALCLNASSLVARITKITIASRVAAFNGQAFGAAGQFEKITKLPSRKRRLKQEAGRRIPVAGS